MPLIILVLTVLGCYLGKQLGISRANERELYTQIGVLKVKHAEDLGIVRADFARLDERSKYAKYGE